MKNKTIRFFIICLPVVIGMHLPVCTIAQNVGIGTATPVVKLHIKGSADASQLVIDANSSQSNTNPLIKLRMSDGTDLMWIHSDNPNNTFIGINAGRINNASGGGTKNTFIGRDAGYSNTIGDYNTANGVGALFSNSIGFFNTAIGSAALYSNVAGTYNTCIGLNALSSNVAGVTGTAIGTNAMQYANNTSTPFTNYNVALGFEALRGSITPSANTGNYNTATGYQSLWSTTSGSYNTATGYQSLWSTTSGSGNTANGLGALSSNTTGNYNTANGMNALGSNTEGNDNVAIGFNTLLGNTKGNFNLACGNNALRFNSTANNNIAIGTEALYSQSFSNSNSLWDANNVAIGFGALRSNQPTSILTGIWNTAIGNLALNSNTIGNANTANGFSALYSNTTGTGNNAKGFHALYSNTTGSLNTADGEYALANNVAGSNATAIGTGAMFYANNTATPFTNSNVAVGFEALRGSTTASNNTGNYNTALGYLTLWNNTSGDHNTAVGYNALNAISTAIRNTAVGKNAGYQYANGYYCTFVGAYADASAAAYANSSVLGDGAVFVGNNYIRIGDGSVSTIGGAVGWSVLSDGRFKTNIKEEVKGLEFISRLRPVIYHLDVDAYNRHISGTGYDQSEMKKKYDKMKEMGLMENETTTFSGFVAQEVEQAARETGYDFSGVVLPKNNKDAYSLRYSDFVMPLVKAVQEQQEIIEKQNKTINDQANTLQDLIKRITVLENKMK